ncbi:hypothetical protein ABIC60_000487 [Phyllobacterium ifriqiyense]
MRKAGGCSGGCSVSAIAILNLAHEPGRNANSETLKDSFAILNLPHGEPRRTTHCISAMTVIIGWTAVILWDEAVQYTRKG